MKRRDFVRSAAAGGLLLFSAPDLVRGAVLPLTGEADVDPTLFERINRAAEGVKGSALEEKHAPRIEIPQAVRKGVPFDLTVSVGKRVHPMSPAHYIAYVELLAGNEPAGRAEFSPRFGVPVTTFRLTLDRPVTLVVRAYCNLHGLWEERREVTFG